MKKCLFVHKAHKIIQLGVPGIPTTDEYKKAFSFSSSKTTAVVDGGASKDREGSEEDKGNETNNNVEIVSNTNNTDVEISNVGDDEESEIVLTPDDSKIES